jgi:hypothetical protein
MNKVSIITKLVYEELHGWKYRTKVAQQIHCSAFENCEIDVEYGNIRPDGMITIYKDYCWDGGSGPAIDTKNSQRGSLFHDFLYQLMRDGFLDRTKYRDVADRLLEQLLIKSGMSKLRAGWWYWAVKTFAKRSAEPEKKTKHKLVEIV